VRRSSPAVLRGGRFAEALCYWREFILSMERRVENKEGLVRDAIASLFQRLTAGVYVVGVAHGEVRNAFTAAWVMQASYDPLLLALSINPHHSSYELLKLGGAFSVNVLKKGQLDLAAHFAGPASAGKLASIEWTPGRTGVPLLHQALALFECQLTGEHPAGDHVLALGKVIGGRLLDFAAEPLSYRDTGAMDGAAALYPDSYGT
jgi:flavin reductase (DIM6/NTAB) family NADH-FMN oxidoreductase RutF